MARIDEELELDRQQELQLPTAATSGAEAQRLQAGAAALSTPAALPPIEVAQAEPPASENFFDYYDAQNSAPAGEDFWGQIDQAMVAPTEEAAPAAPLSPESIFDVAESENAILGIPGAVGRGIETGLRQIQAVPSNVVGVVGSLTDSQLLQDQSARDALEIMSLAPQARVRDFTEIADLDSFLTYAGESVGQALPSIAVSLAGGAGLAPVTARGLAATGLVGPQVAAKVAPYVGGVAVNYPLALSETGLEVYTETGSYGGPATLMTAGANALLDFAGDWYGLGAAKTGIAGVIKSALTEGATEGLQSANNKLQVALQDAKKDFFTFENGIQVLDESIRGALGGGAVTAAFSAAGLDRPEVAPESLPTLEGGKSSWGNVLTHMRDKFRRKTLSETDTFGTQVNVVTDFTDTKPVFESVRDRYAAEGLVDREELIRDFVDAQIPRYVVKLPDGKRSEVMTDTELEVFQAGRPQSEKLEVYEVDLRKMKPAGVTAAPNDLPLNVSDERLFFAPWVKPTEREAMLAEYASKVPFIEAAQKNLLKGSPAEVADAKQVILDLYAPLANKGMRVIPSRGAGFLYNGQVEGKLVGNPTTSGRAKAIAWVAPNDDLSQVKAFSKYVDIQLAKGPESAGYTPITIDTNKIKFNEVTTVYSGVRPLVKENLLFAPTIAEAEKDQLAADFIKDSGNRSAADVLAKYGDKVQVHPKFATYILANKKTAFQSGKLTRAAGSPGDSATLNRNSYVIGIYGRERYFSGWAKDAGKVVKRYNYLADNSPLAQRVEEVRPFIQTVLDSFNAYAEKAGIPKAHVVLKEGRNSPFADVREGKIELPMEWFFVDRQSGATDLSLSTADFKRQIFVTMLHEYGHLYMDLKLLTLPERKLAQLMAAYTRGRVSYGLRKSSWVSHTAMPGAGTVEESQPFYSLTLSEWLAEQFRRALTQKLVMQEDGQFHNELAAGFKALAKTIEEKFSPLDARDFLEPSWAFSAALEYLEASDQVADRYFLGDDNREEYIRVLNALPNTIEAVEQGEVYEETVRIVEEWYKAIPVDTIVDVQPGRSPDGRGGEFKTNDPLPGKNAIRLWVGSLASGTSQSAVAHEVLHAVWHLLTPGERATLVAAGKSTRAMPEGYPKRYRDSYKRQFLKLGLNETEANEAAALEVDQEYAAWLFGKRARGVDFGKEVNGILDRLRDMVEKVKNLLLGRGWNSVSSIAVRIKQGEVAARERTKMRRQRLPLRRAQLGPDSGSISVYIYPEYPVYLQPGPRKGQMVVSQPIGEPGEQADKWSFYLYEWNKAIPKSRDPYEDFLAVSSEAKPIAVLELDLKGRKGYETSWVNIRPDRSYKATKQPIMDEFYKWVYVDKLKQDPRPSGILYDDGYRRWKRIDPASVAYHIVDPRTVTGNEVVDQANRQWLSPNRIKANRIIAEMDLRDNPENGTLKARLAKAKELEKQIPAEYWNLPRATTDFMTSPLLREIDFGIAMAGIKAREAQIEKALTGEASGPTSTSSEQIIAERMKATRVGGVEIQPESDLSKQAMAIFGPPALPPGTSLRNYQTELDQVSWFSKLFFSIKQLSWRNPHISQLTNYTGLIDQMSAFRMSILERANDTAKAWDRLDGPGWSSAIRQQQLARLNEMFFWATRMGYLPAGQPPRFPTAQELGAYVQQNGIRPETFAMYQRVQGDFQGFLNEAEMVMEANIVRRNTVQNPNGTTSLSNAGQAALAKLKADMKAMRMRPYFPMTRFGRHTITVRDSAKPETILYFEAFESARARDAAVREVRAAYPSETIQVGIVPNEMLEFQGLPGPILEALIAEASLPGSPFALNAQQIEWLRQFNNERAPESSFRKRWLERKGTPGYSLDGFRVYSNYFNSGASYLARLAYRDQLESEINSLKGTLRVVTDSRKRGQILEMMSQHFGYLMKPAKDWARFRSFVTLWQLGFSPAAAAINLTQTPMFTLPYFGAIYGGRVKNINVLLASVAKSIKRAASYSPARFDPQFAATREVLIRMGKLETGAAPELGAYAAGGNLVGLRPGTTAQRNWRSFIRTSMWMFEQAERVNREIVLGLSWELSKDPTHPHLQAIENQYFNDITALAGQTIDLGGTQVTISLETAKRIIATREAISRTQFEYGKEYRPKFLQSGLMSSFLVFFSYMQSALFAMGANPGKAQLFLTMAFLFGLKGLPGAEDLDELVRALARRLFGKDFSIEDKARELVNGLVQGTPLDEVGPDLFLHGISRYSFGPGLLQESFGIPQFDASANGSMGRIVPGLAGTLRAYGRGDDWQSVTAEAVKGAAGAGFGLTWPMLQFLSSGEFSDWKKWEAVMPRAVKAASKSARFAVTGEETTKSGATMAQFDMSDPDDIATVIAQGLGFTPTKLSAKWDLVGEQWDKLEFYQNEKASLHLQFYETIRKKDKEARAEVIKAIKAYNEEVKRLKAPGLAITTQGLKTSIEKRAKGLVAKEAGIGLTPGATQLNRSIEMMHPGVEKVR